MDLDNDRLAVITDLYRAGAFTEALAAVEAYLSKAPGEPAALLLKGKLLFETGRKIQAAHVLREVVERDPDNAEAFYALGLTFRHLRKFDDAEGCLRAALRRHPADQEARFVLANVLYDVQNLADAIHEYEALLAVRPDHADAWYNLACAAEEDGRPDVASHALRQFLALSDATVDAEARQRAQARLDALGGQA